MNPKKTGTVIIPGVAVQNAARMIREMTHCKVIGDIKFSMWSDGSVTIDRYMCGKGDCNNHIGGQCKKCGGAKK